MKSFGHFIALQGVDLSIKEGEIVVIIGPSGSGKSTLIRCINQLEEHDSGDIVVDGIEIGRGRKRAVQVEVGMVFQSFNLFPHMTVLRNVALGPARVRGLSWADADERARKLLVRVGLEDHVTKYPDAIVRRAAAARRDRPGAGHGAESASFRRADLGSRP